MFKRYCFLEGPHPVWDRSVSLSMTCASFDWVADSMDNWSQQSAFAHMGLAPDLDSDAVHNGYSANYSQYNIGRHRSPTSCTPEIKIKETKRPCIKITQSIPFKLMLLHQMLGKSLSSLQSSKWDIPIFNGRNWSIRILRLLRFVIRIVVTVIQGFSI